MNYDIVLVMPACYANVLYNLQNPTIQLLIRKSVDFLCRDGANVRITEYILKASKLTNPTAVICIIPSLSEPCSHNCWISLLEENLGQCS